MAHGQADYGKYAPKLTVGSMADNAELATRLGSIVTYDRRGDVIWYDDFESGINKWEDRSTDLGHGLDVSALYARNGGFSAKITCGSNGAFAGTMGHFQAPPVKSKVGLEAHWARPLFNFTNIYFRMFIEHTTEVWDARIRFVSATGALEYWDGAAWQTIQLNVGARAWPSHFHALKFVVDLDTNLYTRLLFENLSFDLSGYTLPHTVVAATPDLIATIQAVGANGVNSLVHIDDVILTQNEP